MRALPLKISRGHVARLREELRKIADVADDADFVRALIVFGVSFSRGLSFGEPAHEDFCRSTSEAIKDLEVQIDDSRTPPEVA